ncbi:MAG: hypothetical protein HOQ11_09255 [Gemmatimonadaceae bacterium]|nr:hypothetical protein [Gemmatimonadaceae bacterium]NUQ94239.1 hypothetical protein [Gemmatimonadaceae bacterium]NUR20032.1 hypothetical protein [Gemmatimonadaceae bacterium]NUS97582.1 hypothetical protein [Gemmatimonadaceae bacterium]
MRLTVIPLALALAPLVAAAQSRATIPAGRDFAHHETIQMGYHEASGYGFVELRPMVVAEQPEVRLAALYNFKGHAPAAAPEAVGLALQTVDAPDAFGAAKHIVFLLDDGSKVTTDSLIVVVDQSSGRRIETRSRKVLRRDFLRIVNSTRVTVRAGALEFALGDEQLEALRDFASRMNPATYAAALAATSARVQVPNFDLRRDFYEAREVTTPASPTLLPVMPAYPANVPRQPHRMAIRYVVDTTGHIDPSTFGAVDPADSGYAAALKTVIDRWEFSPAEKDGKHVRQIVRQLIDYAPTPGVR